MNYNLMEHLQGWSKAKKKFSKCLANFFLHLFRESFASEFVFLQTPEKRPQNPSEWWESPWNQSMRHVDTHPGMLVVRLNQPKDISHIISVSIVNKEVWPRVDSRGVTASLLITCFFFLFLRSSRTTEMGEKHQKPCLIKIWWRKHFWCHCREQNDQLS